MESLSDIGEDALIKRLTAGLPLGKGVIAGVGDDCAVLECEDPDRVQLLKVDTVVEGIHFAPDTAPGRVGWKALCRPLSDLAAMGGGRPVAALISLAAPGEYPADRLEGIYEGIRRAAERFQCTLAGGETVALPAGAALVMAVTVHGWIPRDDCRFRGWASVGQRIVVTGRLGGSLAGGWHLDFVPRIEEARWLTRELGDGVMAMMDLSDGLAKDLPRLARASGVGYRVDLDSIPRTEGCDVAAAIGDGEDYELLMTLDEATVDKALAEWAKAFPDLPLTVIGEIVEKDEIPMDGGWEHFR